MLSQLWIFRDWMKKGKEENEEMAKKKVGIKYMYAGRECTRGPGGCFNLPSPRAYTIPPKSKASVMTGVTVDRPVHIFEFGKNVDRGLRLVDGIWAAQDADRPLRVELENASDQVLLVEPGDTIARFAILDSSGFEVG